LAGLVYGYTPIPKEENVPLLHKPIFWAGVALVLFVICKSFSGSDSVDFFWAFSKRFP